MPFLNNSPTTGSFCMSRTDNFSAVLLHRTPDCACFSDEATDEGAVPCSKNYIASMHTHKHTHTHSHVHKQTDRQTDTQIADHVHYSRLGHPGTILC